MAGRPVTTLLDQCYDKLLIGDDCWEWTGKKTHNGYGQVIFNRQSHMTHRAVYEMLIGPIPEGLSLDHLCRNRGCARPDHLEPVTHAENMRRADVALGIRSGATHCKHGHEFSEENTRVMGNHRACRTCGNAAQRRYNARQAAKRKMGLR